MRSLAKTLERLAGDPECRKRLGENVRRKVEGCCNWDGKGEVIKSG